MQNLIYFLVKDHEVHAEGNIVGPLLFHHNDTTYKGHIYKLKPRKFSLFKNSYLICKRKFKCKIFKIILSNDYK